MRVDFEPERYCAARNRNQYKVKLTVQKKHGVSLRGPFSARREAVSHDFQTVGTLFSAAA
ncbi:MAG: hypothetical protein ACUVWX_07225 [Kiritimatiellia bacterium]